MICSSTVPLHVASIESHSKETHNVDIIMKTSKVNTSVTHHDIHLELDT